LANAVVLLVGQLSSMGAASEPLSAGSAGNAVAEVSPDGAAAVFDFGPQPVITSNGTNNTRTIRRARLMQPTLSIHVPHVVTRLDPTASRTSHKALWWSRTLANPTTIGRSRRGWPGRGHLRQLGAPEDLHWERSASTGWSRAARNAGYPPAIRPMI